MFSNRLLAALLLAAALRAQTPAPNQPAKASISGSVRDALTGLPLTKVTVRAEPFTGRQPANGAPYATTTTDANGAFRMVDLDPGLYSLSGVRNAYLTSAYGAKRAGGAGSVVSVTAGQDVKDLLIRMYPFGVLAGTVRDSDGEPLIGAEVVAFRVMFPKGRRQLTLQGMPIQTDDQGQFRIVNLPPAKYYLIANMGDDQDMQSRDHSPKAERPLKLFPAFYPGVTDESLARTVDLAAGARLSGLDIVLPRARGATVRVRASAPPNLHAVVSLAAGHGDSFLPHDYEGREQPDGTVVFHDLAPGPYLVVASGTRMENARKATTSNGEAVVVADQILAGQSRATLPIVLGTTDLDDVRIALSQSQLSEVQGKVTILDKDGQPEKPAASGTSSEGAAGDIGLLTFNPHSSGATVRFETTGREEFVSGVNDDLTFQATLLPGHYSVYIDEPRHLAIRSIQAGAVDVLRNGLTISGPGTVPLELVLAPDGGTIDGDAAAADDKPAPGATIVVIPASDLRVRHDRYFDTTADQTGHFELRDIPPGEYKLLTFDDVEPDAWFDPDFVRPLEARAQSITLKPNGHETVRVRLPQ